MIRARVEIGPWPVQIPKEEHMTRNPLPLDVSFYVEIFIDNRILGGMTEGEVDRFIELLHEEGASETCHYDEITVSFNHGSEQRARDTVRRALDRLK